MQAVVPPTPSFPCSTGFVPERSSKGDFGRNSLSVSLSRQWSEGVGLTVNEVAEDVAALCAGRGPTDSDSLNGITFDRFKSPPRCQTRV